VTTLVRAWRMRSKVLCGKPRRPISNGVQKLSEKAWMRFFSGCSMFIQNYLQKHFTRLVGVSAGNCAEYIMARLVLLGDGRTVMTCSRMSTTMDAVLSQRMARPLRRREKPL
jgi:hypothetical protein